MNEVWVFNGTGGAFPSAIFGNKGDAAAWIATHRLTGVLTKYPVGVPIYDWAIANGHFKVKSDKDTTPSFIQKFSSAAQDHEHYENGSPD